jgi:hypothetical protein
MRSLLLVTALLVPLSSLAQGRAASVYTSVAEDDCTTIDSSDSDPEAEIDYYTGHCRGKNGFIVQISGGDIRYSLSLLYKGKEIRFTQIGYFHDMGSSKVEWRGLTNGDGSVTKFHSLIYRLKIDDYGQSRDTLFVVRLNGLRSCLIGNVQQSAKMNEAARKIADDMTKPCLPIQF